MLSAGSLSDGQTWQIPNSLLSGSQAMSSLISCETISTQHTEKWENGLNSTVQLARLLAREQKLALIQQIQRIPTSRSPLEFVPQEFFDTPTSMGQQDLDGGGLEIRASRVSW